MVGRLISPRLDSQQRRTAVDLHVARDEHLRHGAADRRRDGDLHLHRLDDGDPVARRDDVAGTDVDADDEGGRRRPQDAGVVTGEAVGDAVDLDEVVGAVDRRHHGEAATGDRQPAARPTERLAGHDERLIVRARRRTAWPAAPHVEAVGRRSVTQLDLLAPSGVELRATAARPPEEPVAVDDVQLHRRRRGRRRRGRRRRGADGECRSSAVNRSSQPVSMSPARTSGRSSRSRRNDLFVVPPLMMTTICASARRSRAKASFAVGAVGDDLGDHRVVLRRDHVTFGDSGVDADSRADRQDERVDRSRGRGEAAMRILGVEPGFDGVAGRRWHRPRRAAHRRRRGVAA